MKNRYFIQSIIFSSISFFIFGCTETENTVKNNPIDTAIKLNHRPVKEESSGKIEYDLLDSNIVAYVTRFDSLYTSTPYYFKSDGIYLFYVCKGELEYGDKGEFNSGNALFGIIDQNNNELLKPIYSKIYNPNATSKGYIEIEKDGKRGLFHYKTGAIIEPQFDVIFPSPKIGIEAFAKKGDIYFSITNNVVSTYSGEIPTYISLWGKWKFNVKDTQIIKLKYSYISQSYPGDPEEAGGVVFTPSYLFDLDFIPEIITGVCESENKCFGVIDSHGELVESYSITDKIVAFISSFYEEGVDGRGWEIDKQGLTTVDQKNNVLGQKTILEFSDWNMHQFCPEGGRGYRLIDKDLIEVYDVVRNKRYEYYDYMTTYTYYKIGADGKIQELDGVRTFSFTKYIKINEKHLTGSFYRYKNSDDPEYREDGNMWASEHLSIEDLDLMRNEIYAEYGLIFKSPKWQEYFSKKSWYKPQFENVDSKLSEIDKANIKLILSIKEKMIGNEQKVTNKHGFSYSAAG